MAIVDRAFAPRIATAVALLAIAATATWQLSKARCFQLVGSVICRVQTLQPRVALTFDDGPTPRGVAAILPVLRAKGVQATFFLIGNEMARHPGLAMRLRAAGHELGNHTWSHDRNIFRPRTFYDAELGRTHALLSREGETRPTLFRPPYGKRLVGLSLAAERAGYHMITWDVEEPVDAASPQEYARRVVEQARPGSIILIHAMYGNRTAQQALPLVIDGLRRKGLQVGTVSELLAAGAVQKQTSGKAGTRNGAVHTHLSVTPTKAGI